MAYRHEARKGAKRTDPRHGAPVGPVLALVVGMTACVTVAGPRQFRFASNRKPEEARACAVSVLRRYGFRIVPDTVPADTARAVVTPADTARTAAVPDTTPPDTTGAARARADTIQADTIQADTIQADTTQADSTRTDTTGVDTVRADTTLTDVTRARTSPATTAGAPSAATRTTVLIRPPTASAVEPDRWWRAEVSIGYDDQGRTVVTSVLGSSRHRDGPYREPSEALDDAGSAITARCTW